jgi:hypothetical protein
MRNEIRYGGGMPELMIKASAGSWTLPKKGAGGATTFAPPAGSSLHTPGKFYFT